MAKQPNPTNPKGRAKAAADNLRPLVNPHKQVLPTSTGDNGKVKPILQGTNQPYGDSGTGMGEYYRDELQTERFNSVAKDIETAKANISSQMGEKLGKMKEYVDAEIKDHSHDTLKNWGWGIAIALLTIFISGFVHLNSRIDSIYKIKEECLKVKDECIATVNEKIAKFIDSSKLPIKQLEGKAVRNQRKEVAE